MEEEVSVAVEQIVWTDINSYFGIKIYDKVLLSSQHINSDSQCKDVAWGLDLNICEPLCCQLWTEQNRWALIKTTENGFKCLFPAFSYFLSIEKFSSAFADCQNLSLKRLPGRNQRIEEIKAYYHWK